MGNELIDISVLVSPTSVVWPSVPRPVLTARLSQDRGDPVNDSNLAMNVHTGTHVDAPRHHFNDGPGADRLPLDALVGEAWVADVGDATVIGPDELAQAWPRTGTRRLLLKTRNSALWTRTPDQFTPEYAALTPEGARWLVSRAVVLVGIDYLSVQRFDDPPDVHRVLLGAGTVIVEGLDLSAAAPGAYELLCLPVKLAGCDGAPARAVLRSVP